MDAQWLQFQFKTNPDKNKADLARALNLDPPAISKILNGTRQIKAHEYMSMRSFFGLPNENDSTSSRIQNRSILQPLHAHSVNERAPADAQWIIPADILNQRTQTPSEKIHIFKIEDAAMEPEFLRGEHILIDTLDKTPSPPGAFLIFDGFGYMIRNCEYVARSSPPQIQITAHGKKFQPQILSASDLEIIGRAMAKLQWL
jgi:hypothetical protein